VTLTFKADATASYTVTRMRDGQLQSAINAEVDTVAEEVPVALVYNGVSHAVMLASPQDLTDFALGFSLSEGILDSASDLYSIEIVTENNGISLQMEVATACFMRLKEKRRSLVGRTGCGLCGAESLATALRLPPEKTTVLPHNQKVFSQEETSIVKISSKAIGQALKNIRLHQPMQTATGATHACAWVSQVGDIVLTREDVGRHNALDKLVGAMAKQPQQSAGFIVTTSRASYEMVQKAASAGAKMLVAISAPTGLAIRLAEQYGITLIGFARDDSFVIYTHPEYLSF